MSVHALLQCEHGATRTMWSKCCNKEVNGDRTTFPWPFQPVSVSHSAVLYLSALHRGLDVARRHGYARLSTMAQCQQIVTFQRCTASPQSQGTALQCLFKAVEELCCLKYPMQDVSLCGQRRLQRSDGERCRNCSLKYDACAASIAGVFLTPKWLPRLSLRRSELVCEACKKGVGVCLLAPQHLALPLAVAKRKG